MSESDGDTLAHGLGVLSDLVTALSVTDRTAEVAEQIYRKAVSTDDVSLVGRGVAPVVGAALIIASRETGDVKTAEEIAAELPDKIQPKRLHTTVKYLSTQLNLGLVVAEPHDYVDRIVDEIGAGEDDAEFAKSVVDAVQEEGVGVNQSPRSVAATAVYYVGAHDRGHGRYTQSEVAQAADLSALTVRNNYQDFSDVLSGRNIRKLQPEA